MLWVGLPDISKFFISIHIPFNPLCSWHLPQGWGGGVNDHFGEPEKAV